MDAARVPLSVCVLAPTMPPLVGGAESLAEVLTLCLVRRGVAVHLLTAESPRPEIADEIVSGGGSVQALGSSFGQVDGQVGWEHATFARAEAVHRVCSDQRIDVVHALSHDSIVAAAIALTTAGEHRIPIVATASEMSTEESVFGLARSRFVYRLPIDGLLSLSRYYSHVADRHGCRARARRIAAAVDIGLFLRGDGAMGRRLLGVRSEMLIVTCPGRFTPRKGQVDLLAALEMLPSALRSSTVCVLAGGLNSASSSYRERVLALVREGTVRCVVGEIPRAEMPDVLAASDLVVLPSHKEGLGFAAIEAMVAGVPVLLADVSGLREIPDGPEQVEFVPAGDPSALAAAIRRLLTDAERRQRLAAAGRKRALAAFSTERLADAVISLYWELLSSAGNGRRRAQAD